MSQNSIFISYRRDDTAGHVGRLYDNFSNHFSPEQVFMDVDHIEPGEDFVKVIEDAVGSCSVLVAVIGRNWLSSADGENRRLDNPQDFVRLEIAAALNRNIRVIPVLVNGAAIPRVQELPDDLTGLVRRQAHALGDGYRWKQDVDRLIKAIEKVFSAQQRLEQATQRRTLSEAKAKPDDEAPKRAEEEKVRLRSEDEASLQLEAESRITEEPKSLVHPWRRRQVILAAVGVLVATIAATLAYQLIFIKNDRSSGENRNQSGNLGDAGNKGDAGSKADAGTKLVKAGMTYVPGGTFVMGRNKGDEAEGPAHQITVAPFYIDLHEVTNEDYDKFVQATSHRAPTTWIDGAYPVKAARKPVTGVEWDDANAYAAWAKKRLPTEEEWEFAARGTNRRLYPWGNAWQQGSANANGASQGMADVGSYRGTSPFGAVDMIGNAWEWTASDLRAYPRGHLPAGLPAGDLKVIRGGTYDTPKDFATTTFRTGWPPQGADTYAQTGFRCAADIAQ